MKSFYKIIISTLLIVIVSISSIEYLYSDYKTNIDQVFESYYSKDSVEVLLNGNSHVGCLGSPNTFGMNSFNFSVGGQDIFHVYTTLKTALQKNDKVKLMIVGIDYDLFGYDYKVANTMWLDRNYYNSTKSLYDSTLANYLMAQSGFFQANRDFGYLKNKFKTKKKTKMPNNLNVNFVPIKGDAKARAIEHSFQKYDISLIEMNTLYLEKLIVLSKSKGIKLVLINLPKQERYYNFYNKEALEIGKRALQKISYEHDVLFLDFWRSTDFADDDFLDGDHLSPDGAKKAIEKIDSIIKV